MTIHCAAVFESGVLRPKEPMALPEGAEVEISVEYARPPDQPPRTPAQMLAAIAALPREGDGDTSTSVHHDRVLYGEKGAR